MLLQNGNVECLCMETFGEAVQAERSNTVSAKEEALIKQKDGG